MDLGRLVQLWVDEMFFFHLVHGGPVTSLAFHPSGNYLVSSSADKTLKVGAF